ncbi:MAG: hypothetical protein KKA10_14370 [Euryarchaeota archaeon]|nr:hypothetical protein [Euryarchaeota archaeon]MCG2737996.1 hypothetical protein [Candidatus Methanoperedenaceae archaeon]
MMTLLVFDVLLFGLFSVLLGQFIGQSREAYAMWIKEFVYPDEVAKSTEDQRKLCISVESLSREICGLTDMIHVVGGLIIITFFVIFITIIWAYDTITLEFDRRVTIASMVLAIMIVLALPYILSKVNISLINPSKSSQIDDKIFEVWRKNNCHGYKIDDYKKNLQPRQLYEILNQKKIEEKITPTEEELEVLKILTKDKKEINHQP